VYSLSLTGFQTLSGIKQQQKPTINLKIQPMNKQNDKLKWISLGIISLPSFILAVFLMVKLCCIIFKFPCSWLGIAYLVFTTLSILLAVWIIYHYYLKMVKALCKKQFEKEKFEKEKELEILLAKKHHEYKLEAMKYDLQKQKLDLEMKKLEKEKKEKKK
jgi:hypothetical protein